MKSVIAKSAIQGLSRHIRRENKVHKKEGSLLDNLRIPIKPSSLHNLPEEKTERTQPKILK